MITFSAIYFNKYCSVSKLFHLNVDETLFHPYLEMSWKTFGLKKIVRNIKVDTLKYK